ncbi:MAG: hypothetical protein SGARI_003379, partial [Bacillariaceae sp.]
FVGASFVQASVKSFDAKSVTLEDGKTLQADAVIVAIGGQYASGAVWKPSAEQTTVEKRIAAFQAQHDAMQKASSIVIAGAGPSGVEVAGEVKSAFPDKSVTLVGSVLTPASPYMASKVQATLESMGVVFKEGRVEVEEPTNGIGETIKCDLLLKTAGFVYAGNKIASKKLKKSVTDRGQFVCNDQLQLTSAPTVYACGDIVQVPKGKHADVKGTVHAEATATIVAYNVVQALTKEKPTLKPFKWSSTPITKPMMSALGPKHGVGDFYLGMGSMMTRSFKSKDYYMGMMGKNFGKGKTW